MTMQAVQRASARSASAPRVKSAPADPMKQTLANQIADFAVPARPRPFWPHRNGVKDMHAPHSSAGASR